MFRPSHARLPCALCSLGVGTFAPKKPEGKRRLAAESSSQHAKNANRFRRVRSIRSECAPSLIRARAATSTILAVAAHASKAPRSARKRRHNNALITPQDADTEGDTSYETIVADRRG